MGTEKDYEQVKGRIFRFRMYKGKRGGRASAMSYYTRRRTIPCTMRFLFVLRGGDKAHCKARATEWQQTSIPARLSFGPSTFQASSSSPKGGVEATTYGHNCHYVFKVGRRRFEDDQYSISLNNKPPLGDESTPIAQA